MAIVKSYFGKSLEGENVDLFTLINNRGMVAQITNYGGTVVSLKVPDKNKKLVDVVLGYDNFETYLTSDTFFGAIIGRNSNRIKNACFELEGETYHVTKTSGEHQLHGGVKGFDKKVWSAETSDNDEEPTLELSCFSKDKEEGFPGNLKVKVTYTVTKDNSLRIEYHAVSDKTTVVNLTNHCYFNLAGHSSGNVLDHELTLNADKFTPVDKDIIPTGEIRNVKNTPMDFIKPKKVSEAVLKEECEQIKLAGGLDHNFVLNGTVGELRKAAEVTCNKSGISMEVFTTMPGVQIYTGNYLGEKYVGKGNFPYMRFSGICLETQYFPNSFENKHFIAPILKKGEEYKHTTIYKFN